MDSSYVGKPCPKCAHVRAASDTTPAWQCPKCGIAYAKYSKDAPAQDAGLTNRPPMSNTRSASTSAGYSVAMFAHLSTLLWLVLPLFAILVPVLIWQANKDKDEFASAAAKEALNFQISFILYTIALGFAALACILVPPLVYVVLLLLAAVVLAYLLLPIVAAFKTLSGNGYTYPFIKHFFE